MSANTYLPGTIVIPYFLTITAITNSNPAIVTVVQSNTYIIGQLVYFSVPHTYNMFQIDGRVGQIVAINGLQLSVNIDTTGFDPFIVPLTGEQPATISPAGSRNLEFNNSTNQVAFQNLNNIGN